MKSALFLNGSPHKNGPTALVMRMAGKRIQDGYSCEWVNIYDSSIKPCVGCLRCRPNGECVLPMDDGQIIGRKMAESDLMVIGSPVYWGNITSPLKTLFDRNVVTFEHFLDGAPKPKLTGKKALIIVTGGAGLEDYEKPNQGGGALQAIRTVLESGGVEIIGALNIHSAWDLKDRETVIEGKIAQISLD